MKKTICLTMFLVFVMGIAGYVSAEQISIKEVKKKAIDAAEYISKNGDEVLKEFNAPKSRWAAEPYVFVNDLKATIVVNPNPLLIGKNLIAGKDTKGKMFVAEFLKIAKSDKGAGWVDYWWPKKNSKEPAQKVTYIVKVPGKELFVGVGIYGYSKDQAIAEAGE